MTTWAWDEVASRWAQGKPSRVRVGEQDAAGWTRQQDEGRVSVFLSTRGQLGIEVEAETALDAHMVASADSSAYREAF